MALAISLWRLFPTQIEAGLSRYHGRRIGEWLADDFTMSSRELLALIEEFPDDSALVKASARTYRVADVNGSFVIFSAVRLDENGLYEPVELPDDAKLVKEFVDWTHDQKIAARHARELAIFRCESRGSDYEPDLAGLKEPLRQILDEIVQRKKNENIEGGKSLIRGGLFGKKKGGDQD